MAESLSIVRTLLSLAAIAAPPATMLLKDAIERRGTTVLDWMIGELTSIPTGMNPDSGHATSTDGVSRFSFLLHNRGRGVGTLSVDGPAEFALQLPGVVNSVRVQATKRCIGLTAIPDGDKVKITWKSLKAGAKAIVEVLCLCELDLDSIALNATITNSERRVRQPRWGVIAISVGASLLGVEHLFKFLYTLPWEISLVWVWIGALSLPLIVAAICVFHYRLIYLLRFWLTFGRKGLRGFGLGR